jgi:hypothetical protein
MRNSASTFATDGKNCAEDRDTASTFRLQCVVCSQPSETSNVLPATGLACPECKFALSEVNGIFRCLAPDRELHFEQFVREYELVRSGERLIIGRLLPGVAFQGPDRPQRLAVADLR